MKGATKISLERGLVLYRSMARIRAFENAAEEASKGGVAAFGASLAQAQVRGPLHLSTGQEAVAARQLLAAAREIDREFLARIGGFPVRIEIRYERIEPLRLRRIELGLDAAYRILDAWRSGCGRR